MLKRLYDQLLNVPILKIGIKKDTKSEEEKKIWLTNIVCILHLISFIQVILLGFLFDSKLVSIVCLLGYAISAILILLLFYLQHLKQYIWAKLLLITISFFTCFIFDVYILPDIQIKFFYIFPPLIALCIFNNTWQPIIFLFLSLCLLMDVFHLKNGFNFNEIHFTVLFSIVFLIVYFLIKVNKKHDEKLKQQHKELKQLNEFKSHFFVNLSHEIRTPLTLIQGHASQIDLNTSKDKTQEQINVIKYQSEQINDIINNILDLSKIDTNEFRLKTKYIDVCTFLNKHYTNFKELFTSKGISFSIINNSESLAFKVDDYMFSKSINNLLTNSLKFTPSGGTVTLEAYLENQTLIIEVSDTGIGIPQKDINRIFERFFQSKNHITKSQGSGIGLSFTKSIIEAHNFSIKVKSTPNIKTTFTIKIPSDSLQKSNAIPKNTLIKKEPNFKITSEATKNSNRKILIVEDHLQMLIYISNLLKNYNIITAKNGKEALNILKDNTFDLIITDYMMPIMDGEALVNTIKDKNIKSPILVLTARTDNEAKIKMLRLGIDGYLNKPFIKEELFLFIKKAFQSYDIINKFDQKLKKEEKEYLNKFAQKFNDNLNSFIKENMHTSNFGIESIAEYLNISKSTLNRKTKSLLGQTPKDIIMEARLQKAKKLLEDNPTETQKNIANAVGISNTSYFFKKMEERFYIKK